MKNNSNSMALLASEEKPKIEIRFVDQAQAEAIKCSICFDTLYRPSQSKCMHSFCSRCIRKINRCAQCRVGFPGKESVIRNLTLEQLIQKLHVKCIHSQCNWEGPLHQMYREHLNYCPLALGYIINVEEIEEQDNLSDHSHSGNRGQLSDAISISSDLSDSDSDNEEEEEEEEDEEVEIREQLIRSSSLERNIQPLHESDFSSDGDEVINHPIVEINSNSSEETSNSMDEDGRTDALFGNSNQAKSPQQKLNKKIKKDKSTNITHQKSKQAIRSTNQSCSSQTQIIIRPPFLPRYSSYSSSCPQSQPQYIRSQIDIQPLYEGYQPSQYQQQYQNQSISRILDQPESQQPSNFQRNYVNQQRLRSQQIPQHQSLPLNQISNQNNDGRSIQSAIEILDEGDAQLLQPQQRQVHQQNNETGFNSQLNLFNPTDSAQYASSIQQREHYQLMNQLNYFNSQIQQPYYHPPFPFFMDPRQHYYRPYPFQQYRQYPSNQDNNN